MTTTVIIPTYNAEKFLPDLLQKLKQQTVSFELLIIDSSSTDRTVEIAQKYTEQIIIIPKEEFDHGGTRTKAVKAASGEIVVLLTQDALPCNDYSIEEILKVFDNVSIAAAYGRQVPYETSSIFGKHLRKFNYGKTSYVRTSNDCDKYGIKTAFLSDSFAAYRKSALQKIGYFKNGLIVGEDMYAGAKMLIHGFSLAYCAEATVYHSHSYTVCEEFKRYFDIGVFHKNEQWILDAFGNAEGEGGRYVKSEMKYLLAENVYWKIPEFFIRNGMKYLGYKLGNHYEALPGFLIIKLSMHKSWWLKSTIKGV